MTITLTYDSDDNFSNILNITNYFKKEERINELIEKTRIEKKREVILAKINDYDDNNFKSIDSNHPIYIL